ncbi:MAG: phosphohistidine phosphatase SixA [Alkalinema sp. RU_4_3]|nr:phosphohistidine phosphatase SixA [Alkalinema sp. RU_4_3]
MTLIYLVRHGLAGQFGEYADDRLRPLTPEGQAKTRRVAERLKGLKVSVEVILTSPYLRALQTAEILLATQIGDRLETADFLEPDYTFESLQTWLTHTTAKSVAIVGHEPNLSNAAAFLTFGQPTDNIQMKKAGVIGIETPAEGEIVGRSTLFWLAPPRLLL